MPTDILDLDTPPDVTSPSTPRKPRSWNSAHYPKAIVVRVTNDEHAEINRRAGLARATSTSRYLAECGLRGRAPQMHNTPLPTAEQQEQFERMLYELRKVGTNLNQLTHAANLALISGNQPLSTTEITSAVKAVESLIKEVKERL